jgi:beta-glucosidase
MKGFKKVGNARTWRGITVVSAFVAVVFGSAIGITKQWESTLNAVLGTSSSKLVETDSSSLEDSETYKSSYDNFDDMYSNAKAVAENIESEGAVLLKNDNGTLPLDIGSKISCFSRNSVDIEYGSTGLAEVDTSVAPTLKSALEDEENFEVNPTLWDMYEDYTEETSASRKSGSWYSGAITYSTAETPMSYYTDDVVSSYSSYNDAAIVTISRSGGEGSDLPTGDFADGTNYLALQDSEKAMLAEVESNFDQVIVLINSGWALQLDWLDDYDIDAALWIGTPGQRGLASVDDLLVGNINPSGRLSDTYASSALSAPAAQNAGDFSFTNSEEISLDDAKSGAGNYLSYNEDIYIGYKY